MFMLGAHYRSPINFSREMIEQANAGLTRLYTARNNALFRLENASGDEMTEAEKEFAARADKAVADFNEAMNDDLNTADAIGVIFEYVRDMNAVLTDSATRAAIQKGVDTLNEMTGVLGILTKEADLVPENIKALVQARQDAKKAKDFARADEIRGEITALGYVVEDTPKGPKVRKA